MKLPLLDAESCTRKKRGRAQRVAGHHQNPLTAVVGQFQHARRVRLLDEKNEDTTGVLPPRSRPKSSPKIGGRQIDDTDAVSIGYRKSYGRLSTFAQLGPMMRCSLETTTPSHAGSGDWLRRKKRGLTRLRPHWVQGRVSHFRLETGYGTSVPLCRKTQHSCLTVVTTPN